MFTTGDISERAQDLIAACNCPVLAKPFDLVELAGMLASFTRRARDASA